MTQSANSHTAQNNHPDKQSRDGVLRLLRAHLASGNLDTHEKAMTEDMIHFVERNVDCAKRSLAEGHLTGSAWILDTANNKTLLTHHRKLDKWLQLGGHADGDLDLPAVAMREAREESGLARLKWARDANGEIKIFDVDRHRIPARGAESEHWHYDIRFIIEADSNEPLVVSSESKDLAWITVDEVARLNPEESMVRMVRKTLAKR